MPDRPPKTVLECRCGELIQGADEDELVRKVREHLAAAHPGLSYTREQILFLAF